MFIFHFIRLKCQSHSEHSQNTFLIGVCNLELQKVTHIVISVQRTRPSCSSRKPRVSRRWLCGVWKLRRLDFASWSAQGQGQNHCAHCHNAESCCSAKLPCDGPPERFIFLLFRLYAHAGCFSVWLMRTAVWDVVGAHKLQSGIFTAAVTSLWEKLSLRGACGALHPVTGANKSSGSSPRSAALGYG